MSAQPNIWINVTTSKNWRRPPVGIVRVERSVSEELRKIYGRRVRFCVWLEDRFVEVDSSINGFSEKCSEEQAYGTRSEAKTEVLPWIYPLLPKRKALAVIGQGALSLMPKSIRPVVNRLLYRMRPLVIKLTQKLAGLSRKESSFVPEVSLRNIDHSRYGDIFSEDDVVLSLGLDWDYPFYKQFYFLRKAGVKVVTCCYDLIPVLYPQYCVGNVSGIFSSYFLDVADGSDLVLCISKQSEKDLLHFLHDVGGNVPRTHVFALGDNVPVGENDPISSEVQDLCGGAFILFVSTIERRKNHEVLYRAYSLLCQEGRRSSLPKLVFVGMQGWGVDDFISDIELDPLTQGLFVRLNNVSDGELRALYESSMFCVFPSLYEGWGLPVGEALSLGKAVISSDRGSLPEVGGGLVRYVDPWCPRQWAEEIYHMATDEVWRCEHEERVRERYKVRTWAGAAESISRAIDEIE